MFTKRCMDEYVRFSKSVELLHRLVIATNFNTEVLEHSIWNFSEWRQDSILTK